MGIQPGNRSNLSTAGLAIFACLLWSTAFVGVKVGLRHSDPFSFAGIRFMLAGLLLVPFWWQKGVTITLIRKEIKIIFLVAFYQTLLLYGLFYLAMTMVSGAVAAILIGASPLTAAVVAHFMVPGDTMSRPKFICLCLGMTGVVLLSVSRLPWISPTGWQEFIGIFLLLISTISSAYGNVLVADKKSELDPVALNSLQIFLGGLLLYCISIPTYGVQLRLYPLEYYGVLIYLSLLSALSFSLWFILLRRPGVRISQLNVWKFIIPVFGALISWALLPEESPTVIPVVGMILIGISIVLFNIPDIRHERLFRQ